MALRKVPVVIVGGGPCGLLLSHLLQQTGIENIVLEQQTMAHVQARIRAGVLESRTCNILREAGLGDRLEAEGQPHSGFDLVHNGSRRRVSLDAHEEGQYVMVREHPLSIAKPDRPWCSRRQVYGQTEVTRDLLEARSHFKGAGMSCAKIYLCI